MFFVGQWYTFWMEKRNHHIKMLKVTLYTQNWSVQSNKIVRLGRKLRMKIK